MYYGIRGCRSVSKRKQKGQPEDAARTILSYRSSLSRAFMIPENQSISCTKGETPWDVQYVSSTPSIPSKQNDKGEIDNIP
ncbi:hypothetical protein INT44_004364 [Umbelopsis vinacea]|uniref:Uncharacterized protein n=1 Tax=Umbelopsis vinacea TaxID=44442 RepID=A0A8H7QB15_9FUNG|nr:hypothetical protein INT44_004364 [Umbelopsis vinacea]